MRNFLPRLCLPLLLGILPACVYDPGVAYYQPAPVYTRPSVTYVAPPPSSYSSYQSYGHSGYQNYSPRYVPPPPPPPGYYYRPRYVAPASVGFYYSMPYGSTYVRVGGKPCWRYNGCYYRRNSRGAGFVLFTP
jgi:hypothetical protein